MASYSYHYTATGGNFCKRVEEKEELQKISDRFAAYIARVRQLREEKSAQIDTASFLRATQILEEEIRSLKALYESELEKIRREGDGFKKEYSSLHIQYERSCQLSKELQERLDAERGKNGSLSQEIGRLRSHVSQLELKYREAYEGASKPNAELEKLRGDLKKALRELEAANVRYEQEVLARQDGDNKAKGALEKMRIAAQVHAKELADWKARLDAANATILEMEKKLKFKGGDVNVQAMIKQVRDAADAELNKFKIDTNEKYAQNCGLLKKQIEEYAALIDRLTKEKQQALDLAEDLRLRNSKLEGQMTSFRSEIGVLEAQITQERRASAAQLQALNMKMKEFQDKMFARINISGGTSSDNVMLKAEIEALKAILEQAESG